MNKCHSDESNNITAIVATSANHNEEDVTAEENSCNSENDDDIAGNQGKAA